MAIALTDEHILSPSAIGCRVALLISNTDRTPILERAATILQRIPDADPDLKPEDFLETLRHTLNELVQNTPGKTRAILEGLSIDIARIFSTL